MTNTVIYNKATLHITGPINFDKLNLNVEEGGIYHILNCSLHNSNGPAVILANGDEFYYKNGLKHRENDEPAVILANGYEFYYKEGVEYTPEHLLKKPEELVELVEESPKLTDEQKKILITKITTYINNEL